MKELKKTLAMVSLLIMATTAVPAMPCFAYSNSDSGNYTTLNDSKESKKAQFAVVMWTETDGELTITGCMPMTSVRVSDYPTSNVVSVFLLNGKLVLPSHINDKPVTKIKGYNITAGLYVTSVTVNEVIDIEEDSINKDIPVILTDKENKVSPIYYYTKE